MRKAFFKKVTPGDITLKINNVPTRIKPGQIFEHYFEIVHKIPGIQFVCFSNSSDDQRLFFGQNFDSSTNSINSIENQQNITESNINEKGNEFHNNENLTLQQVEENKNISLKEEEIKNNNPEVQSVSSLENKLENKNDNISNIDILLALKNKTNKEIFSMKKKDLKKILTDCNIDFSHIPDSHIDLYKFLLSILQKL